MGHRGWDHGVDCTSQPSDLADEARGQVTVLEAGRHEEGRDTGHGPVHVGHLHLSLEVGQAPQALDDDVGTERSGQVHHQP